MHRMIALALTLAASAAIGPALAAPGSIDLPAPIGIEQVSGGCGRGGYRDGYGYCRPNRRAVYRRCPYGYHLNAYGCRRNY